MLNSVSGLFFKEASFVGRFCGRRNSMQPSGCRFLFPITQLFPARFKVSEKGKKTKTGCVIRRVGFFVLRELGGASGVCNRQFLWEILDTEHLTI